MLQTGPSSGLTVAGAGESAAPIESESTSLSFPLESDASGSSVAIGPSLAGTEGCVESMSFNSTAPTG